MARIGPPPTVAYLDDGHPESRDCADNYRAVTDLPDKGHRLNHAGRTAAESTDRRHDANAPTNPSAPRH